MIAMRLCERKLQFNGHVFKIFSVYSSAKSGIDINKSSSAASNITDVDGGDCVICLTNPVSGTIIRY
jgi:hypothetical protein